MMFFTGLTFFNLNFSIADLPTMLVENIRRLNTTAQQEFGQGGSYMMSAFAGFLVIILIIYIKSVIDTFRPLSGGDNADGLLFLETSVKNSGEATENTDDEDTLSSNNTASAENNIDESSRPHLTPKVVPVPEKDLNEEERRNEALWEKEKELSRQIVLSSQTTDDILQLKNELKQQAQRRDVNRYENMNGHEELLAETKLHYEQQKENLNELVCLIINMLSRNVSEMKTAQAVYTRNGGQNSEEDVLQIVQAVQSFIALCNNGKFDNLPDRESLPQNGEALYSWAEGDSSKCLLLLESLINKQIETAESQDGLAQKTAYAQASSYACLFGTIAGMDNRDLAKNSFELALELTPKNINAWSRYGDTYWDDNDKEKAFGAYQTVLTNGEDFLYAQQQANAGRKLALYYTQSGNLKQAETLQKFSDDYYDSTGLRNALSEPEEEVLSVIAAKQHDNLQPSIARLLKSQNTRFV